MWWMLSVSPALALDCTGLDGAVCDAANAVAAQINAEAGSTLISDTAPVARFRTNTIYQQLLQVDQTASAQGCLTGGVAFLGTQGGLYHGSRAWEGVWAELPPSTGQGAAAGTWGAGLWDGAFSGDEAGAFGTVFAVYNPQGQVAGDREGDFFMGIWRRIAGNEGYYATVWGTCAGAVSDAFDGWYVGDLPDALPSDPPDPQPLGTAAASFSQGGFPVTAAVDGDTAGAGWAINPQEGPQTAVFETISDTPTHAGGTEATFQLIHTFSTEHLVGCFELAVTTEDRGDFADGVTSGGQLGDPSIWTPVDVISAVASNGATMSVSPAGRIVVQDLGSTVATYTVVTETALSGLTGFRLDVCEDASLPNQGPGTQDLNGNFVLSEITLATRAR